MTEDNIQDVLREIHALKKLVEAQRLEKSGSIQAHNASIAKQIYAARAVRSNFFSPDIFGEPGWDILLSLRIAEHGGSRMTVGSVCSESGVPVSTALRWIDRLIELNLVKRTQNPLDSRSSFVELSEEGLLKMELVLERFRETILSVN